VSPDIVRAYDRSKSFYTLVGLPSSEVVLLAADRPGRYSVEEWESLLQVRKGRGQGDAGGGGAGCRPYCWGGSPYEVVLLARADPGVCGGGG
jgi:hypothetical protein